MVKFLKQGKVVILTQGRFAGKKAIIVKAFDEGTKERQFPHALVAGLETAPQRVRFPTARHSGTATARRLIDCRGADRLALSCLFCFDPIGCDWIWGWWRFAMRHLTYIGCCICFEHYDIGVRSGIGGCESNTVSNLRMVVAACALNDS